MIFKIKYLHYRKKIVFKLKFIQNVIINPRFFCFSQTGYLQLLTF